MRVVYRDETIRKYKMIRPHEDSRVLEQIFEAQPFLAIIAQIAFEAGRDWQSRHTTAEIDFPDYDAPEDAPKAIKTF